MDRGFYRRVHFDFWLLMVTILLVSMGVTMVYSSSALLATEKFGDSYYFLKKEIVFSILGFGLLAFTMRFPYYHYKKLTYPILAAVITLLIFTFVPGLRAVEGGAARWVKIMGFSFQPSEFAKFAVILFLSYSLTKKRGKIKTFTIGYLTNAAVIGVVVILVMAGRDFGSAMLIALLAGIMLFAAGVRLIYLLASVLAAIPVLYMAVASVEYRRQRILAFLDPWADRYGSGFQTIQSFVAFSQGGIFGQGLGEGKQKLFYLPEAHTDFIASVLGEELGMMGTLALIIMFGFFAWRGFKITFSAPDAFGRYMAFGTTLFITLQAMLNLLVVTGFLPTKGMVLPFVSYGGSAMLTMLAGTGVLLNISSFRKVDAPAEEV